MDNNMNINNNSNINNGSAPDYMLWLVLGIVQICTLCCCNCFTFIFGILTVIFACIANTAFKNGNMVEYHSKIKLAKILNIVGWVLLIGGTILNFVMGVFEAAMDMFK